MARSDKYTITEGTLTDIGDAIRAKTGKSALIDPVDMPSEIGSISGGGGGSELDQYLDANNTETTITIPGKYKNIRQYARAYGGSVTELILGEGIESVGDCAFMSYGVCTKLTLPSTLKTIGASAFSGLSRLTGHLDIPDGVTSIGNSAFNSGGFKTITIPASLSSCTGYGVFGSNGYITNIYVHTPLSLAKNFGPSIFSGSGASGVQIWVPWDESEGSGGAPWGIVDWKNPVIHYGTVFGDDGLPITS